MPSYSNDAGRTPWLFGQSVIGILYGRQEGHWALPTDLLRHGGKATRLPSGSKQEETDTMALKHDIYGNPYHEPPYTAAEEMEMYRRMSGVVAYTRIVKAVPAVSETAWNDPEAE